MRQIILLAAGCLLSLHAAATPVRDWSSPGLELSAGRGDISVRGHVASTVQLGDLRETALSGQRSLVEQDVYLHVLLPDHWQDTSSLLISLLTDMHSGSAFMDRDRLTLRGTVTPDSTAEAIEAQLKASVPAHMAINVDVWQTAAKADACRALLGTLLDAPFRLRAGEVSVSGEHYPRLNRIADAAARCPSVRLRVTGHTDNTGDPDDNARISAQRAGTYGDYLVAQGVAEKRVIREGRGSAEPVGNNRSAAGRKRNRRVAIEIYSPP